MSRPVAKPFVQYVIGDETLIAVPARNKNFACDGCAFQPPNILCRVVVPYFCGSPHIVFVEPTEDLISRCVTKKLTGETE